MSEQENCTHQCGSCAEGDCSSRTEPFDFSVAPHPLSSVGKVIGVISGKGGVGKSLVTSLLAAQMQRRGYACAILDADVTGPSIPKMFGLECMAGSNDQGILPVTTKGGTEVMSVNLLLQDRGAPVIWRGPAISDVVKQFWSNVIWSGIDFMFVDMPPGTGDVPLTVFQSLPVDGIIVVASPQELVSLIVGKAVRMAEQMNIPILGIVENMSHVVCPDCGAVIKPFGESKVEESAAKHGIELLGSIPIDPELAALCDKGEIEKYNKGWLDAAADILERMSKMNGLKTLNIAVTKDGDQIYQHFGHTRYFEFFEVAGGEIKSRKVLDAEGSGHSALGGFLKDNGVDLLICGGIGGGAKTVLAEAGVELISGATGNIEEAVKKYLAGDLQDDPSGECDHHNHGEEPAGECRGCGRH